SLSTSRPGIELIERSPPRDRTSSRGSFLRKALQCTLAALVARDVERPFAGDMNLHLIALLQFQRLDFDVEIDIGEGCGDDLGAAVMAVLAELGGQHARPPSSSRAKVSI